MELTLNGDPQWAPATEGLQGEGSELASEFENDDENAEPADGDDQTIEAAWFPQLRKRSRFKRKVKMGRPKQ